MLRETAQLARVVLGELPPQVRVMTFFGCTVDVKDGLRGCIDESSYFKCLIVLTRASTVVLFVFRGRKTLHRWRHDQRIRAVAPVRAATLNLQMQHSKLVNESAAV